MPTGPRICVGVLKIYEDGLYNIYSDVSFDEMEYQAWELSYHLILCDPVCAVWQGAHFR